MIKRRIAITPVGCFLLGLLLATAMFAAATTDLALPSLSHPKVGETAPVTYRVPAVHLVQELDEKNLYWRARFEVPVGTRITHDLHNKLRALEEHRRPPGLGFAIGLGALLLGLFVLASFAIRIFVRNGHLLRVQLMMLVPPVLLLGAAKVLLLLTPLSVFWIPLAALSMTWAILHTRLAGLVVGATGAVAAATLFPLDWGLMLALAAQALVPPLLMDRVRKRRSPGLAWIGGAAAALVVYLAYHWMTLGSLPPADVRDLQRSGLLAVVGAAAMSPLLCYLLKPIFQPLLGVVSPSKLLQLSDMDQPLLTELAAEAPGTWQHTLAMSNLAEVVCNAIGADGKLARVGAYYHDVGKLTNPRYFAENLESGERSPHLDIAPEESADAIFEHVSEGERLAREAKVPYAVREFIFTHHGDGLLEFFWHKCQEQGNSRDLPETAFRYPGIPPQTKETAILAIVDAVEAASKTLKEPSADQIDGLVRRIVFGKLLAGQLDEARLTAADLATVVSTLQDVLRSQHHVRPEYPWQKKEREQRARESSGEQATVTDPPAEGVASAPRTDPPTAPAEAEAPAATDAPVEEAPPDPPTPTDAPVEPAAEEAGPAPDPADGVPVARHPGVPEDRLSSPLDELSAALEGDISGPVPQPMVAKPEDPLGDDTIREPRSAGDAEPAAPDES